MIKPTLHLLNQGRWQPAPPTPQNIELILVGSQLINSFTGKFRAVLVRSTFKIQQFNNAELIGATGKKIAIDGKCFALTHERWNATYERLFYSDQIKRLNTGRLPTGILKKYSHIEEGGKQ